MVYPPVDRHSRWAQHRGGSSILKHVMLLTHKRRAKENTFNRQVVTRNACCHKYVAERPSGR
jgi:hypothetical protein